MDNEYIATNIVEAIGENNVVSVGHCLTRLRFIIKNKNKVDLDKLDSLQGIKGALFSKDQLQIFVDFKEVEKIYDIIAENLDTHELSAKEIDQMDNDYKSTTSIIDKLKEKFKD